MLLAEDTDAETRPARSPSGSSPPWRAPFPLVGRPGHRSGPASASPPTQGHGLDEAQTAAQRRRRHVRGQEPRQGHATRCSTARCWSRSATGRDAHRDLRRRDRAPRAGASTTSRSSTCTTAGSPAPRRWCAGRTRPRAGAAGRVHPPGRGDRPDRSSSTGSCCARPAARSAGWNAEAPARCCCTSTCPPATAPQGPGRRRGRGARRLRAPARAAWPWRSPRAS